MAKSSQTKIDYNKAYNKKNNYANQNKYRKTHPNKSYGIRVFENEMDIIEHMEKQKNKAGYIKDLIREDMLRQKESK